MNAIWMLYSVVEVIGYYGHVLVSINSMLMHNHLQWMPPTALIAHYNSGNHSGLMMVMIIKPMVMTVRRQPIDNSVMVHLCELSLCYHYQVMKLLKINFPLL